MYVHVTKSNSELGLCLKCSPKYMSSYKLMSKSIFITMSVSERSMSRFIQDILLNIS